MYGFCSSWASAIVPCTIYLTKSNSSCPDTLNLGSWQVVYAQGTCFDRKTQASNPTGGSFNPMRFSLSAFVVKNTFCMLVTEATQVDEHVQPFSSTPRVCGLNPPIDGLLVHLVRRDTHTQKYTPHVSVPSLVPAFSNARCTSPIWPPMWSS